MAAQSLAAHGAWRCSECLPEGKHQHETISLDLVHLPPDVLVRSWTFPLGERTARRHAWASERAPPHTPRYWKGSWHMTTVR